MRRRMLIVLAVIVALNAAALAIPRPSHALSAWFEKGKSDCSSLEAAITLTYNQDDTAGDADQRDYFKLEIYDAQKGDLLAHIEESITQEQSPFYWQTGRIDGKAKDGLYKIEMWDTDAQNKKLRLIDQAFLQCQTQNSWRTDPVKITPAPGPEPITCYSRTPIYTTNGAPQKGAVIIQWTYGRDRTELEYHLQTIPIERGHTFNHEEIFVPCGTYLRIYYQPESTKLLYYMPSQYWPHDLYGTAMNDFEVGPVYHTFYPLDGPTRPELTATATPTTVPAPTSTLTPTP